MKEEDTLSLTSVQGPWTVELTHEDGTVWRTPVIAWSLVRRCAGTDHEKDLIQPVVILSDGCPRELAFDHPNSHKRLLFHGEDPYHMVAGKEVTG